MFANRSILVLCIGLLSLFSSAIARARPVACESDWLARTADTLGPAQVSQICARQVFLTHDSTIICADSKAEYRAAFESICPAVKQNRLEAVDPKSLLRFTQLYMANGNALDLPFPPSGHANASAPVCAAAPTAPRELKSGVEEGITAAPIAGEVAQGIANFLLTRAEAEVSLFATSEFFSKLCQSNIEGYFQRTCTMMRSPDGRELTSDPPSLATLRAALIQDLKAFPKTVIQTLAADAGTRDWGCTLDVAYALGLALKASEDPWQLFRATKVTPPEGLARYASALPSCGPQWSAIEKAAKSLTEVAEQPAALLKLGAGNATAAMETVNINVKGADVKFEVLAPWARVLRLSQAVAVGKGPSDRDLNELTTALFRTVSAALRTYACKNDTCKGVVDESTQVALLLTEGEWSQAVAAVLSASKLQLVLFSSRPELRRLLAAVAAVAEAGDSDAVEAALERYAAPVGSWRGKHEYAGMGLVGLVGFNVAHEDVLDSGADGGTLTPTLALGVDAYIPWGFERVGLQFPLIDIGNVASVRYDPDSEDKVVRAETRPDIEFTQLFAPGAYVFASLGKSPFTIGGGCSWIPDLRTVVDDGISEQKAVIRCGGTLAIDITLLPLVKF